MPNATVELRVTPPIAAEHITRGAFVRKANYGIFAKTDADGRLELQRPADAKRFEVFVSIPDFAPYWAAWSFFDRSKQPPATFTAELDAAWSVEGIIVDDEGRPVAGAKVHASIEFKKRPGYLSQLGVGTTIQSRQPAVHGAGTGGRRRRGHRLSHRCLRTGSDPVQAAHR